MAAYGGGATGFERALITLSAVWLVAIVGAVVLDRRTATTG